MRKPIPMVGFKDRDAERNALIEVHQQCLVALLEVVQREPGNELLKVESVRFFDEALWAVTEIKPGRKHDTRFVSEGVKNMIDEHNQSPRTWRYGKVYKKWYGRTDPRKCAEHEHVVTRQKLCDQLLKAGPDVSTVEQILRRALGCLVTPEEHALLAPHADVDAVSWERYVLAPVKVWDRKAGDWVKM